MIWQKGRQGTGYEKIRLLESKRFKFDVYLLRYKTGTSIPVHTDPAPPGFKHYRLNIILKKAVGGHFVAVSNTYFFPPRKLLFGRIILFRPDKVQHAVTRVKKGTRYVLSIGWLRKKKKAWLYEK